MSILENAKRDIDLSEFGYIVTQTIECYHETPTKEDAENIFANGYNMRKSGQTGKRFNAPPELTKYDPQAIFAMHHHLPNKDGNFVEITMKDVQVFRYYSEPYINIKRTLYEHLECRSAKDFTNRLKELGIDAIAPEDDSYETIIINIAKAEITKAGFDVITDPSQKPVAQKPIAGASPKMRP